LKTLPRGPPGGGPDFCNDKGSGLFNTNNGVTRSENVSEEKVSREASRGEFRKLYETVFPILFRVSYRITSSEEAAEDLCQEAFFLFF
jgi:hypothetical protein